MLHFPSLLSPWPALREACDGRHAVRMESLSDCRALDGNQAFPQEEQRDDKVGDKSACGNCFAWGKICVCLTASLLGPVPLQVCRRNGADRQGFQPVHRLTANHIPNKLVDATSQKFAHSFSCSGFFSLSVVLFALQIQTEDLKCTTGNISESYGANKTLLNN